MGQTKEGAKKVREINLARDPNFYSNMGKRNAGVPVPSRGFGSKVVGRDGLTGEQRAKIGGKKSRKGAK